MTAPERKALSLDLDQARLIFMNDNLNVTYFQRQVSGHLRHIETGVFVKMSGYMNLSRIGSGKYEIGHAPVARA